MPRPTKKLSHPAIMALNKPGCYADGDGLYLQVAAGGTKAWLFRYMRDGRAHKMGLGSLSRVSLAKAREKAAACGSVLGDDQDPLELKKAKRQRERIEKARAVTFKQCAERYIEAHRAGWKNARHAEQWPNTLRDYVYDVFGDLSVAAIDVALVLKVVEPIWVEKPETAGRVRGRIELILDWAKARGYRHGENPARWRGHLDKLLPARGKVARVQHHPALPYVELPGFMEQLRGTEGVGARALEFAILTATRTGEALGAGWSEIDLKARMWTIPAARMKAGKEHRIPLSDRAVEILEGLPREQGNNFVFIGARAGRPVSSMAFFKTLRRMERGDLTAHGFRSSFRDWAAEQTAYPSDLAEMALAHAVADKVEAAYRRGDMLEKRRRMMADWAAFCTQAPTESADNVMPIRGAGVSTAFSLVEGTDSVVGTICEFLTRWGIQEEPGRGHEETHRFLSKYISDVLVSNRQKAVSTAAWLVQRARDGDSVSDFLLRRWAVAGILSDNPLPRPLGVYISDEILQSRDSNKRRGRNSFELERRDAILASAVWLTGHWGVRPTRTDTARNESGCSIVATALGKLQVKGSLTEMAIRKIWEKSTAGKVWREAEQSRSAEEVRSIRMTLLER